MEVGADCGGKGREGIDSEENDLEEGAGRGGGETKQLKANAISVRHTHTHRTVRT